MELCFDIPQAASTRAVAVVTGASGGIGGAVVRGLLEKGLTVVAADRRMPEEERSERFLPLELDVTDVTSVASAVRRITAAFGRIDVLVNAAGIFKRTPLVGLDENAMRAVLEVNLMGAIRCMAAFGAVMASSKGGRIINIASIAGEVGAAAASVYAASKAGLIAATESAARELGGSGVRVNAVAPGFTDTPMLGPDKGLVERFVLPRVPAGRLASPEEIAELVVFLATSRTDYLSGSVIRIDGGLCVG